MLSLVYLAAATYFGDRICRLFYRFTSVQHRIAASFLVGLVLSTCITYLGSLAFFWSARPLVFGNLIFLIVLVAAAYLLPNRPPSHLRNLTSERAPGAALWDWIFIGGFFIFACWLVFATLGFKDGNFQIPFKAWNDFGANLSVMQSFVWGHNFPTEHPFFAGERIRYHFLFWFQTANLEFLGLNPVWSVNLLSLFSLAVMLILIMTLAELLFNSRPAGRISASLFFFSSSLSYLSFLMSQHSIRQGLSSILAASEFLPSGYPFRGETWGALTVSVFANQRHLISGIGVFLVVLIFLVERYQRTKRGATAATHGDGVSTESVQEKNSALPSRSQHFCGEPFKQQIHRRDAEGAEITQREVSSRTHTTQHVPAFRETNTASTNSEITSQQSETSSEPGEPSAIPSATEQDEPGSELSQAGYPEQSTPASQPKAAVVDASRDPDVSTRESLRTHLGALIFSGALIGMLPYWNSAVFVSAVIVLGAILLVFPCRLQSLVLVGTAALIGLPQVLLLRSGNAPRFQILHWGYTLEHPTLGLVLKYLGWTFGLKWVLILIALILLSGAHRRLFIALSALLVAAFLFQFSPDIFNNHKLLNVWAVSTNVYAGYALWRIGKVRVVGVALAIVLSLGTIFGGIVDLFPIHNDAALTVPYKNDPLSNWLFENTEPSDVFLSQTFLTHPILFTGRKVFMAYTLFAWTAGYNVGERDRIYHRMFEEQDAAVLVRLLRENKIAYVAIDDGVRGNRSINRLNESVYQQNFHKVFDDTEHRYANLVIYKVPAPGLTLAAR